MATTGGGYDVDPLELRNYANYTQDLAQDVETMRITAMYEGMNPEGFTGLLKPIGAACKEVRSQVLHQVFDLLREKLHDTAEGVRTAARQYGLAEAEAEEQTKRAGNSGGNIAV